MASTYTGGTGMAKATEQTARVPILAGQRAQVLERPRPWVLSATDLTFLWEECRRCFYKKVAMGHRRPSTPFPKVFGVIDRAMKDFYLGERAESVAPGAPAGVFSSPDRWVKSAPIAQSSSTRPVILRGRLDVLVTCDDGTNAVVDFKTALPSDSHVLLYGRQLHAYAWALEQPASGLPRTVSSLGLLSFMPERFGAEGSRASLVGDLRWVDVARDDLGFEAFLRKVVEVLEAPEPPLPARGCRWCRLAAVGPIVA
jgi:hypothetical protein